MTTRSIERPGRARRRSSLLPLACGCLATFAILFGVVLVAGVAFLPRILSSMAGLTPVGDTAEVFAEVTPQPTLVLQNATEVQQVTVDLGSLGQQTLDTDPQLYNFTVGTGNSGQQEAMASFTEAGLMEICHARSTFCSANSSDPRFRNARIDLRPGGAVVYVDTTLPQLQNIPLTAGVVVRWDAPTRRVVVEGVDIGGQVYTGVQQSLSDLISTVEARMNDLIQQVAVQASGGRFSVSDVIVDDTTLTLVLR
jgi:hypothetical protein